MRLVVCERPEQVRLTLALRYEVYCLEKGWVDPSTCTDGLETDEHDANAVHFLVLDDDGERVLGSSRLLIGAVQTLPTSRFLDFEDLGIDVNKTVEVSRMASSRGSRSHDLGVWLGLTKVMWQWCLAHDMTTWVSTADVPLFALMRRSGMPIIASGDRVEYLGSVCIPSAVDVARTGEVLERRGFHEGDWVARTA